MLLRQFAGHKWTLDEFVSVVNEALPLVLPGEAGQRGREEVNARLVRHYTTLGMLDEPGREGKEARYTYRHLLQVLLLRRMLSQGYGTAAIDSFARRQSDVQLAELLSGKLELTIKPNPALQYLEDLKKARGGNGAPAAAASPTAAAARWARHPLASGLELHVREDYQPPSDADLADILQTVKHMLRQRGR